MPSISVRVSNFMLNGFLRQPHVMLPRPRNCMSVAGRLSKTPLPSILMEAAFQSIFDVMSASMGVRRVEELTYTTGKPVKLTNFTVYSLLFPSAAVETYLSGCE